MSKFKYVLSIVVLSMVLSVTGCGASNGNQHADSSVAAEESSPAETTQKADNSQTDAPADQEEEKEPSHDLTGADAVFHKGKKYYFKEFLSITSWATCFIAFLYKISG